MFEKDPNLSKILMMAGFFRLDQGCWPQSAVELKKYAEGKGWNLDLNPYYTLSFRTDEWRCLVVEVGRLVEGWVLRERIDMEPYFFEQVADQSIPLRIRSQDLPARSLEGQTFCPISA